MKKILFVLLVSLFYLQVSAFDFNTSNHQEFDENAWIQNLSNLSIDIKGIEIKDIRFIIDSKDYFIFDNDLTNINTEFTKKTLSNWNKELVLWLENSFSWQLNISWIKIRLYDQEIRWAKIGLDYNNDWIIDMYSTNYIDLEENDRYGDNMKPLPITNLIETIISDNSISFVWSWSIDLDSFWTLIRVYKNNDYWPFIENFIWKTEQQKFTLDNLDLTNNYKLEFYSKDNYYLTDKPVLINLNDLFKNNDVSTWSTNTGTLNTSTWTTVSTWVVDSLVEPNTSTWTTTDANILEIEKIFQSDKYLPTFKTISFNTFMVKFDKIIDKKLYKEEVRIARNDIIKLLKDYEDNRVSRLTIRSKLKNLIIKFVEVYK